MRIILSVFVALLFIGHQLNAQDLKKVKVNDGKISLKIPAEFTEMELEDIGQRLPSVRLPIAAYTDLYRTADLSVKISATKWGDNDLDIAMSFFKASFSNLFDKVDMLDEGIIEIKKKKYIYFEFESIVRSTESQTGERKYNFIVYHIKDLKTLVVSFRCSYRDQQKYQPFSREILQSLNVKKI